MRRAGYLVMAIAMAIACGKKSERGGGPSAEITGLAAVPENAEAVIGVDVGKLADSAIVERAILQLFRREPALAARWTDLRNLCKLEIKNVNRLMLALGPAPGKAPAGPALLIATGQFSEQEFVKCVREVVGKGGGTLTVKTVDGRTLYHVKDANRTMYLGFGRADTVVLGNNDAYVTEALGTGKKALDNPELASWLKLANQNASIWVVGRVSDRIKGPLMRLSGGNLKAGTRGFTASFDLSTGVKADLVAVMDSPDDAKQLEMMVKTNLVLISMWAQKMSLGPAVQRIETVTEGKQLRIQTSLTMAEVNNLLSVLDAKQPPAQDSPPANGSASSPKPP